MIKDLLSRLHPSPPLKIFTDNIEDEALKQIDILSHSPVFSSSKIRIMPDVHAGKGCVIGFTADLKGKVIPNTIGVDIGCGMLTISLGKIDIDYQRLDEYIRNNIPSGRNIHEVIPNTGLLKTVLPDINSLYCINSISNIDRVYKSLGTLGGGNHFIEIDEDEEKNKYLIIHTGSRNLGKQVCDYYQRLAVERHSVHGKKVEYQNELIRKYKEAGREKEIESALKDFNKEFLFTEPPEDLCYLEKYDAHMYLSDMRICQDYAQTNRVLIAGDIIYFLTQKLKVPDFNDYPDVWFHTVHNYIDSNNIVRKGAIAAYKGQKVLIPLNMRDGCILGIGKGNKDWNCSAPHGAGRIMSRHKAKEELSLDEYKSEMSNVYSNSVSALTIDESPMAYKSSQEIIEAIKPTVKILKILKPVYNFKAEE